MKKTKKHNIKNISFLALTFSALCLAGCNAVESSNSKVVEKMPQAYVMQEKAVMPKRANESSNVISLTMQQLVNYVYDAESNYSPYDDRQTITIKNLTVPTYEGTIEDEYSFNCSNWQTKIENQISNTQFQSMTAQNDSAYLSMYFGYEYGSPNFSVAFEQQVGGTPPTRYEFTNCTIEINETDAPALYQLYYVEPPSMGEQIVDGIESGLGMIGTLASEFLAGFGALFYVNNQLTPFAIFSLVFLGIAITFAIIKLCLNVVRSNTGA